ncbi:hypothetical protein SHI21_04250 [Bacteriovorax sp. PP10]|uniref:Lipocalin-like domain-containing protein n=1 Tax=Bacteriovorax antarcticus TaxID=3088717 RepID=A0ABU5VUT6_9BACT|nr:hypothetical protein [Bacteriovorax sp. PP10]MEA9355395.1 hypothetical protein [Bacteriovorax sp. PP10]
MKNSLLTIAFLALASLPAVSNAGFMDNLQGSYSVGGKKCKFEATTTMAGTATITPNASGAVVNLKVVIASLTTEIPVGFRNGSGDVKSTKVEGDILPLPVTRRTVWNTDEVNRKSTITEYEGVGLAKKRGTYTLAEENNGTVTLSLEEKGGDLVQCTLTRN